VDEEEQRHGRGANKGLVRYCGAEKRGDSFHLNIVPEGRLIKHG